MRRPALGRRTIVLYLLLQAIILHAFSASVLAAGPATRPYVLHLPGVGGFSAVDRSLIAGLKAGGVDAEVRVYDWVDGHPGIPTLHDYQHNRAQAALVAKVIAARVAAYPRERIVVTSHSGGGAMAVWALEDLPPGVQVDDVLLLATALSPGYDLSAALRHVRGHVYVFWSTGDELILGIGCRICGTMDGKSTDAAGRVGFIQPPAADVEQYRKLDQHPYSPDWAWLGNFGDHVGPMAAPFAKKILAPLVIGKQ